MIFGLVEKTGSGGGEFQAEKLQGQSPGVRESGGGGSWDIQGKRSFKASLFLPRFRIDGEIRPAERAKGSPLLLKAGSVSSVSGFAITEPHHQPELPPAALDGGRPPPRSGVESVPWGCS